MQDLIKYSDVFDEEFNHEEAYKLISTEDAINLFGCILFDYCDIDEKGNFQIRYFNGIINGYINSDARNEIKNKLLNRFSSKDFESLLSNFLFIHPLVILIITERISNSSIRLRKMDTSDETRNISNQMAFKLILFENEKFMNDFKSKYYQNSDFFWKLNLYEFTPTDYMLQITKSTVFYKFLMVNEEVNKNNAITNYLNVLKSIHLNSLLDFILQTYLNFSFKKRVSGRINTVGDLILKRVETNKDFFDRLNYTNAANKKDTQKLHLQKHPLYLLPDDENGKGGYIFVCYKFLVDKFTTSIYFDLKDFGLESNTKGTIGTKYFEEVLCDRILNKIYADKVKKIILELEKPSERKISNPDYYIELGNNIMFIECKDKTIGEKEKTTSDIKIIQEKLLNELYKEKSSSDVKSEANSGVPQILEFISEWKNNNSQTKSMPKYNDSYVLYPVLLVDDAFFDLPMLNKFIIDKFLSSNFSSNIKPPVIIRTDTFLGRLIFLSKNNNAIFYWINDYVDNNSKNYEKYSFEEFVSLRCSHDNHLDIMHSHFHLSEFFEY